MLQKIGVQTEHLFLVTSGLVMKQLEMIVPLKTFLLQHILVVQIIIIILVRIALFVESVFSFASSVDLSSYSQNIDFSRLVVNGNQYK